MEEAELELMDLAIKNIDVEDANLVVTCEKNNFADVQKGLKDLSFHVVEGALVYIPKDTMTLSEEEKTKLESLVEQLEEDDDVSEVFTDVD